MLKHSLPEEVVEAVKEFTDPEKIKSTARETGLDVRCFPAGKLSIEVLHEAEALLKQVNQDNSNQEWQD